jgi:hypothetical protein
VANRGTCAAASDAGGLRDSAIAAQIALFGSIQSVAPSFGVELSPFDSRDAGEIERAVTAFAGGPNGAADSALAPGHDR